MENLGYSSVTHRRFIALQAYIACGVHKCFDEHLVNVHSFTLSEIVCDMVCEEDSHELASD